MAIDQLTAKIYNKLSKANLAGAEGKVAVQFNLTGTFRTGNCHAAE